MTNVEMYRDGLRVEGRTLSECAREMEAHPCFGLVRGRWIAERRDGGWEIRARFAEPRAVSHCWQGHDVELVDGFGRCHCGETIARFEPEVE